eukprot:sb/3468668/
MQRALSADSFSNSHPISSEANTPSAIAEMFDAISYRKGACILQMLNKVMKDYLFFEGINKYLTQHEYSNAEQSQLYDALNECSTKFPLFVTWGTCAAPKEPSQDAALPIICDSSVTLYVSECHIPNIRKVSSALLVQSSIHGFPAQNLNNHPVIPHLESPLCQFHRGNLGVHVDIFGDAPPCHDDRPQVPVDCTYLLARAVEQHNSVRCLPVQLASHGYPCLCKVRDLHRTGCISTPVAPHRPAVTGLYLSP